MKYLIIFMLVTSSLLGQMPCGNYDFNSDDVADILWHKTDGTNQIWLMCWANNALSIGSTVTLPPTDLQWTVWGVGEFNEESASSYGVDILWRTTGGTLVLWLTNWTAPGTIDLQDVTHLGQMPTAYTICGVSKLVSKTSVDIIWKYADAGVNRHLIWYTNSTDQSHLIPEPSLPTVDDKWNLVGSTYSASSGAILVWRVQNTTVDGSILIWKLAYDSPTNKFTISKSTQMTTILADTYLLKSIADFDNDGMPDLLWVNTNLATKPIIWYLNTSLKVTAAITFSVALAHPFWVAADFTKDGQADYVVKKLALSYDTYFYKNAGIVTGAQTFSNTFSSTACDSTWTIKSGESYP